MTKITRRGVLAGAPLALAACAAEPIWAPDAVIDTARFVSSAPPSIELLTMRNIASGNGAHSSLVVNASQRVIFDPAGTFRHASLPERNDVIFGVHDQALSAYRSYHARVTFYMVAQTLILPAALAERTLQYVMNYGAVPKANCTRATSATLQQLPEIGSFRRTWFPDNLERQFAKVPGVTTREYRETDSDDLSIARDQLANTTL